MLSYGKFLYITSIKSLQYTRYLLHYLQNTLQYYKYNTTRSKISCLPRGFSKEKKKQGKSNKAKLRGTILKKKIQKKVDVKGDLVAA